MHTYRKYMYNLFISNYSSSSMNYFLIQLLLDTYIVRDNDATINSLIILSLG